MRDDSLLLDYRALALLPVFSGEYLSKIITTHGIYFSKSSTIELLNKACLHHHSSKQGRKDAAKQLLGFYKKTPFLISDDVAVFPTTSPKDAECIWIFGNFFEFKKLGKELTEIKFNDRIAISVPVSLYTIRQQKSRVHMLLSHAQQSKRKYILGQVHLQNEIFPEGNV